MRSKIIAAAATLCSAVCGQNLINNDLTTWTVQASPPDRVAVAKSPTQIDWRCKPSPTPFASIAIWRRFDIQEAGPHLLWLRGTGGIYNGPDTLRWNIYGIDSTGSRVRTVAKGEWVEMLYPAPYNSLIPQWVVDLPQGAHEIEITHLIYHTEPNYLNNAILTEATFPTLNTQNTLTYLPSFVRIHWALRPRYTTGASFFAIMLAAQRLDAPIPIPGVGGPGLWLLNPLFVTTTNQRWFTVDCPAAIWPRVDSFWQVAEVNVNGLQVRAALGSRNFITTSVLR